jgi:hypothetical protein
MFRRILLRVQIQRGLNSGMPKLGLNRFQVRSKYRCPSGSERRRQARPYEGDPPEGCWRTEALCRMPLGMGTQNRLPSIGRPVLPCPEVACQTGMPGHKTVAGLRLGQDVLALRPAP